ncbi:MAG: elongation factor P [Candidatus Peregrinibacteria bacterium]|nr:elongation factor P [Candidatus Peregrinibacteria bacterium]
MPWDKIYYGVAIFKFAAFIRKSAMLEYNEITSKRFIVYEGAPFEVLDARIFRMQQRKPVNQTKLRNLITGKVTEVTFHQADKVDEAEIDKREIKYLYNNRGQWWFCEASDPSKRFMLPSEVVGDGGRFLKANSLVEVLSWDGKLITLKLPIKVDLKVTEAPPAVRGDTSKGGSKQIVLETGATINAPLFINEGEIVRINTETGDYVERA